jgi:hypothetical protein
MTVWLYRLLRWRVSNRGTGSAIKLLSITRRKTSMNQTSRVVKSAADELPADIVDLAAVISRLPENHRQQIEAAFGRVVESTKRRRRILTLVQDALGQLRLDMKYLMFDLEATRRERDEFRRQLEET